MMKKLLFLVSLICELTGSAQNYIIDFTGAGASTSVTAVKVENLRRATSLPLNSGDVLRLVVATAVYPVEDNHSSEIRIYPNPMTDYSTVQVFPPEEGNAVITVLDITGKQVAQIQSCLEACIQDFRLSGLKSGFYLINVTSNNYQFAGKLQSNGKSDGPISIEKINNTSQWIQEKETISDSKGILAIRDMAYTIGDRLKFTGTSGDYTTIVTDIPQSSKTITFNFIACKDGDNNNYPVVEIGSQIWMAENLKTTKYRDGTSVPLVDDAASWTVLNGPGYCWYNNDEASNKNIYGALYHWLTGNTGNLCPTGWHVPSDPEWTALTTFLGGESVSAGKLKQTGTTHWAGPNTGVTNESGFTALPGGNRGIDGTFSNIGSNGCWDSATEYNTSNRYYREMHYNANDIIRGPLGKRRGISVRCIMD
jgi:uncharacterized protein (TIGR02145 family)